MYLELTQFDGEKLPVNSLAILRLRKLEGLPTSKTLDCKTEVVYIDGTGLFVQESYEDINEKLSKIFFE